MAGCKKLVVIGTDTDVGKTVLSLLIMRVLMEKGKNPFYVKPFQTGCMTASDTMSDAAFIYQHTPGLADTDPAISVINCHKNPKAPWFSARDMGQAIDVEETIGRIREKEAFYSHLVIEAAGGLLVPVTEEVTMADFLKGTGATPVLAARAGLGTINHTLMTVECLKARGISPAGIVFMNAGNDGVSKSMIRENMEAVERFSGIPVAGVVGKINDFGAPDQDVMATVTRLLQPFL